MTRHTALNALNALSLATIPKPRRKTNRADRIAEAQVYALLAIADAIRTNVIATPAETPVAGTSAGEAS